MTLYPDYLSLDKKKTFMEKLKVYVEKIYGIYKEIYKEVQTQEKKNHDLIMEKGEVDEENQLKVSYCV